MTFKVGSREISDHSPTFIVAEAACNHMCDLGLAKKMIDEAKEAGADAIKFQTYKADRLVSAQAKTYWNYSTASTSQYEYYKRLDRFEKDAYEELFSYANDRGLIAFSTPFDVRSATMLFEVGAPLFKVASCDLLDTRLIRHVAQFKKPMIVSTGGSDLAEIRQTVDVILSTGNQQLAIMACTLNYPSENEQANLNRIRTLKQAFPSLIIGYSDHTRPDEHMVIPSIAVAMGARIVEKHYTLDRTMTGSGHAFSIEPRDLKKMVQNIRLAEKVLGESEVKVYEYEKTARLNARRSLVAEVSIKAGETVTSEMIAVKRPGNGLAPDQIDFVIGKKIKTNIEKDDQILLDNLL